MAKRDPNKTARNRMIATLKERLREMLPNVLLEVGLPDEQSLNATLGSKHDDFFDLKNDVIHSQEEFLSRWLEGLKKSAQLGVLPAHNWLWGKIKSCPKFREYAIIFVKRSYLKHFDELSKNRPSDQNAEIWIGQENANYGLLVTPVFVSGKWRNDRSEIRSFPKPYWIIGHVMETGLVIPGKDKRYRFSDIDQYLLFFSDTLVRNSGSKYEYQIAEHYSEFVKASKDQESIPLLIPEFRYGGLDKKHVYRLDFMIINPYALTKVGFELSPWSTHGYLAKTKGLSQEEINKIASDNFAKEMRKHRSYFKEHDVYVLIYTDDMLKDTKKLFDEEVKPYLCPEKPVVQLSFQIMNEFFE